MTIVKKCARGHFKTPENVLKSKGCRICAKEDRTNWTPEQRERYNRYQHEYHQTPKYKKYQAEYRLKRKGL